MLENERITTPIWKKILYLIIVIIIFAIQIALYTVAIIGDINGSQLFYVISIAIGVVMSLFIINSNSPTSYKLTWVVLISIMPIFFSALYVANFNSKILPKRKRKKLEKLAKEHKISNFITYDEEDVFTQKISKLVYNDSLYPTYKNVDVTFFNDAELKHNHMIEELKKAEKFVFMEYFILSDGYLLNELLEILEELGNKGVEIKILYDDIGSKRALSRKTINKFVSISNLKLAVYEPLGLNINPAYNYRDHRKMCIIDGKMVYCGGDNLADEYIHKKERFGFWRDNAVLLDGKAVYSFIAAFADMWYTSTRERINLRDYIIPLEDKENDNYVIPFFDGPNTDTHVAYNVFMSLINQASKTLYISTPYLIIDDDMLNAICLAAKSGVDVKILVPKIPDKKTVFMMTRAHYKKLLESGVAIYEFTKGFNHAKNIIVDGEYAFCGTVNMDYRSLFLHYECGVVLLKEKEIAEMEADFLKTVFTSENYTLEKWNKRNVFSRFFAFLVKIFSPML